jgi:hypothetical protein
VVGYGEIEFEKEPLATKQSFFLNGSESIFISTNVPRHVMYHMDVSA